MDTIEDDNQYLNESQQTDNIQVLQPNNTFTNANMIKMCPSQDQVQFLMHVVFIKIKEYPFQVVMAGDSGVGKTSFLIRFSWDTAGQESFRSLSKKYFQKADAVVVMFDITNNDSFNNLGYWTKEIHENCKDPNIPKILVGHKSDLNSKRRIDNEEIMDFANSQNMEYIEASAKDNHNVVATFAKLSARLIDIFEDGQPNFSKNTREMLISKHFQKQPPQANCKCCLSE